MDRSPSMDGDSRAEECWCLQPRSTRGEGAGRPPPRGKAGGAAEKDELAVISSSADNFSRPR